MSYVDVNTPVIEKITLPSGNTYFIADREIRDVVQALSEAVAGGVKFIICWDGTSVPVVANIPAGVVVIYNSTTYTGTLSADSAAPGAFYLVKSATQAGSTLDVYDEYVPTGETGSKTWEKIGDTQIDLSNVVTGVSLTKQTDTVIGSDATFTIIQPTVALSTGATAGEGVISVATGITSVSASGDNVTALTGLGKPSIDSVIGADATFTITQPTIELAIDKGGTETGTVSAVTGVTPTTKYLSAAATGANTSWNSKDQVTVLTGVQVTADPTITLTANAATDTGRITYLEGASASNTNVKATASGANTAWNSKDQVTALTGLGTPSTDSVIGADATFTITQPTIALASNNATATGRVQVATGAGTSSSTNTDWLKGVSVSNGTLTIGAATVDTTYLGATASGANTAWNNKDSVTAVTGYASPTTDTVIGSDATFTVTQPTIALATGATAGTGVVSLTSGISPTTKYLSAAASGTTVGADGTDTVIGSDATFTITQPTISLTANAATGTGRITYVESASVLKEPLKATATGANTEWDSKDTVDAVTGYTPTTDTVLGTGSTITVTPTTTNIKATASGANTAWNNKDQVTVLTSATDVSVTKGA